MSVKISANVPEIRFREYTTEWSCVRLGRIFDFQYGNFNNNPSNGGPYPVFGANGIIGGFTEYNAEDSVVIGHMGEYAGSINWGEGKHFVTYNGIITTPKNATIDAIFGYHLLAQLNIRRICGGSGQPFLSYGALDGIATSYPESLNEQSLIGSYFKSLDRLIELQHRKHDKLVALKQAMLQKMFPQDGATTPAIRFKGFQGEWEARTFGETMLPISSNTLSRADLNYKSGSAKNVHYGDILVRFGEVLDADNPEIPFITNTEIVQKFRSSRLQDGDVVFADAAEDETVGKCTEVVNIGDRIVLAGLHTIAVRPSMTFAPFYLGYFLNSHAYHNQLLPLMQGTKVLSVSRTSLHGTSLLFPSTEDEQAKIGTYLYNLDKLISKHATQLEKLKNIKSACLEKMFV